MVNGRHGSHGRPTDCVTAAATTLATTATDGIKLFTDDLFR